MKTYLRKDQALMNKAYMITYIVSWTPSPQMGL